MLPEEKASSIDVRGRGRKNRDPVYWGELPSS